METIQISLPNSPDNFLLVEMCERLKAGYEVTMLFGGVSMLPLINGNGDKIKLRPLKDGEACVPGKVYLYNCYKHEHVKRENVLAQLTTIIRPDGREVDCEGEWWRKQSRKVVLRRSVKNLFARYGNRYARKKWSVVYFVLLAVLMWAPLGGLGLPLDNYVLGLRLDHLLHASVFLFCPLFMMDWMRRRKGLLLLAAVLVGLFTEFVQYLLPYRGFDINDLIANCGGNLIGWLLILSFIRRHP